MATVQNSDARRAVKVWDLPTRVFHGVLIVCVAVGWATAAAEGVWFRVHVWSGYVLAAALLFRLVWGFAGSAHSRFADFVRPWPAVRDYAARLARLDPPPTVGHNPLGGWMVVALLALLALLAGTGLFAAGDAAGMAGPLARYLPAHLARAVTEAHEALFHVVLLLAALHVAGALFHALLTGERLVRTVLTGVKELPEREARVEPAPVPAYWAALIAVVSGAVVWFALA
ncbi:MAG: hypothetical protein GEU92_11640 [Alphaproteobacteria bacterium]|nr:hypothetical protein [Alphaproteobacteria bacterium]